MLDSRKVKDGFNLPYKKIKKNLFDLDSNEYELTHQGQKLEFNEGYKDDLISSASEDYEPQY